MCYYFDCDVGDWDSGVQNITTGSEETSLSLRGLRPARTYFCRVRAENSVGLGDPSEAITVVTVEEGESVYFYCTFSCQFGNPLYCS